MVNMPGRIAVRQKSIRGVAQFAVRPFKNKIIYINDLDPLSLMSHAPSDEYDGECEKIISYSRGISRILIK